MCVHVCVCYMYNSFTIVFTDEFKFVSYLIRFMLTQSHGYYDHNQNQY